MTNQSDIKNYRKKFELFKSAEDIEDARITNELVVPDMVLWIYGIVFCFCGVLLNLLILRILCRTKCKGKI